MFLSCRPFVVITTLSTGLVGVEVPSVSWLGIMSEIFLQNMESEHFHNIIRKHKIRLLARYVDDILVIYDIIKIKGKPGKV